MNHPLIRRPNLSPAVFLCVLSALMLCPSSARADRDVTVVVDMTDEGRALAHPTASHPAYYAPVVRGYHEMGDLVAGEKGVAPRDVIRAVAPQLARQNYRVIDAAHPTPDMVVDVSWGYITRSAGDARNLTQRYALTLGNTFMNIAMPETIGHEMFMEAARDPRYFIVVTAYDYATWAKEHRRVILWKTRMSVPSDGVFFDDVLVSLAKAGGSFFGRETSSFPKLVPVPVPKGRVQVGSPTVKTDDAAAPTK